MTDDLIKIADMQHTKSEPNMQTNTNRKVIVSSKKFPNSRRKKKKKHDWGFSNEKRKN